MQSLSNPAYTHPPTQEKPLAEDWRRYSYFPNLHTPNASGARNEPSTLHDVLFSDGVDWRTRARLQRRQVVPAFGSSVLRLVKGMASSTVQELAVVPGLTTK